MKALNSWWVRLSEYVTGDQLAAPSDILWIVSFSLIALGTFLWIIHALSKKSPSAQLPESVSSASIRETSRGLEGPGEDDRPFNFAGYLEQLEELLRRRDAELQEDIERLAGDREAVAILENVREVIHEKLADLSTAYQEWELRLASVYHALDGYQRFLNPYQLDQARESLEQGETRAAEALLNLALEKGAARKAEAYYHLGLLAESRIDFVQAAHYFYQAATLQPDHLLYLSAAGEMAYTLWDYHEAERLFQSAVKIQEKLHGSDHSDLAQILNNLGALYYSLGRYDKAEALYQWSLEIDEKVVALGHPNPTLLKNYAALLRKLGREADAVSMEARAAAVRGMMAQAE